MARKTGGQNCRSVAEIWPECTEQKPVLCVCVREAAGPAAVPAENS